MLNLNEFVKVLGNEEESSGFFHLISMISEPPIVTKDPDEYNDPSRKTKYYSFPASGILIGIRGGVLDHVHFYIDGHEGYRPYEGDLLEGINAACSGKKIVSILGTPVKTGGGKPNNLIGFVYRWLMYEIERYKIRLELTEDDRLRKISLMLK